MEIEYDGKVYEYNEDQITVYQALKIEEHTGGTLLDYTQGLLKGSARCYQALGWVLFKHADIRVPLASVDFPVLKLAGPYLTAFTEMVEAAGEKAAAEEGAGEDPTPPSGAPAPVPAKSRSRSPSGTG